MRKSNRENLRFFAPKGAPQKAVFVAVQSVDAAQGAFNAAGQLVNAPVGALARRASSFFTCFRRAFFRQRRSTIHRKARSLRNSKAGSLRNSKARSRRNRWNARSLRKARRSN